MANNFSYRQNPPKAEISTEATIGATVERMRADLVHGSFVPWKFYPKDGVVEPPFSASLPTIRILRFVLSDMRPHPSVAYSLDTYAIRFLEAADVQINFLHADGALHGLTTFTQLFYRHSHINSEGAHHRHLHASEGSQNLEGEQRELSATQDASIYAPHAPLYVLDYPTFQHRGLNLDISSNALTPADVMKTIEGMAFNKLNKLHLIASNKNFWSIDIPSLPILAEQRALNKSAIWSVLDLEEVQRLGSCRGIEVYLELDILAHEGLSRTWDIDWWEDSEGKPRQRSPKTPGAFVNLILEDVLPRVAPFSQKIFHIGGHKVDKAYHRQKNPFLIVDTPYSKANLNLFLHGFASHAVQIVADYSLLPIVWDELLFNHEVPLDPLAIIQTRRTAVKGRSRLAQIVERKYKAIFGPLRFWRLDPGHNGWLDLDPTNPESLIRPSYLDYCGPLEKLREVLSYDPLADISAQDVDFVLGGEAHMIATNVSSTNLDHTLWPRLAAAAEVLWRGKAVPDSNATRRLAEMREWLVAKNITAGGVQFTYCLRNEGACVD